MTDLLQTLLAENLDSITHLAPLIDRQVQFPDATKHINVAIGMRRSGKTYFLYQTILQLLANGVPAQRILYVNFEDERLLPMDAKAMGALLDSFYRLYPDNHEHTCYFFLDEVQNIENWALVVRRFFDKKKLKIYLTGSSAKLLSKEIASTLRGRSLSVEIWPYSFQEYCVAHTIEPPHKPFGQRQFDKFCQHMINYFIQGGFPGVQDLTLAQKQQALQTYVDTVILRDIIERYNVSNVRLLNYLCSTLLKNAGCLFTVNKFHHSLKSQGIKVSKSTIYTYIDYLEDAFLVFTVPFYHESDRIRQNQSKKIYAIDSAIIQNYSLGTNALYGKLFENLIYLDLRRQNKKLYYYHTKDKHEVDFVTLDNHGQREIIQVCWDLNDANTLARETHALQQAEQELGIKGRIISLRDYFL